MSAAIEVGAIVLAALALVGFGPSALAAIRRRRERPSVPGHPIRYDPGRELRAERKARELMRSVVSAEEYAMYTELGFLSVRGADERYAYLVYPHRPILAYDTQSGELLS